jgi:hypothetical protein
MSRAVLFHAFSLRRPRNGPASPSEVEMTDIGRVLTAMVTPFRADGAVDYEQ